MTKLVHAIIGCGRIAPNHADGFGVLPDVELRWACDRDETVAKAFAAKYDIPRFSADLDEVLADPELASVTVSVDHAQHAAVAERALRAGKHVLVEKPFTTKVSDARAVVALAQESGLVLSVISQHRYDAVVEAVRSWIAEGLLGTLTQASVVQESYRTRAYYSDYWHGTRAGEGGSALINQGYHSFDVLRLLCGDLTVTGAASGALALADAMENEDTIGALLRGPNGLIATYAITVTGTVEWRTRIGVTGTEGSVVIDIDQPGLLHFCSGSPELVERADALRGQLTVEPPPGTSYYGIGHRKQIAEFCAAITDGTPIRSSAAEGLATIELIDAVYTAAGQDRGEG
ncbi:MAG TPA: Gfo/Idh/MocA family oxidoreductase [Mycobacteriales bacterium]|jgi:predicted dehydrogenase|nr:Gfo/Idh/MocA family oxidoreductase [Mycobacteriales bacterium]